MHIAEVVTITKSLPLLRLNTYKSLILSYSADYRRIFRKNRAFLGKNKKPTRSAGKNKKKSHNINKKARKHPHFPASLPPHSSRKSAAFGKNRGFLGKTGALLGKFPCFWGKW